MLEVMLASKQLGIISPEQQCERLAINEVIAKGASGTVYLGRWRNMDVAVKVRCEKGVGIGEGVDCNRPGCYGLLNGTSACMAVY